MSLCRLFEGLDRRAPADAESLTRAWAGHGAPGGRGAFPDLVPQSDRAASEVAAAGRRVSDGFRLSDAARSASSLLLEARLDALADDPDRAAGGEAGFRREIALWRAAGAGCGDRLTAAVPP